MMLGFRRTGWLFWPPKHRFSSQISWKIGVFAFWPKFHRKSEYSCFRTKILMQSCSEPLLFTFFSPNASCEEETLITLIIKFILIHPPSPGRGNFSTWLSSPSKSPNFCGIRSKNFALGHGFCLKPTKLKGEKNRGTPWMGEIKEDLANNALEGPQNWTYNEGRSGGTSPRRKIAAIFKGP